MKTFWFLSAAFLSSIGYAGSSTSGGPPAREVSNVIQLDQFKNLLEKIDHIHEIDGEQFRIITADPFRKRILMEGITGSQLEFYVLPSENIEFTAE